MYSCTWQAHCVYLQPSLYQSTKILKQHKPIELKRMNLKKKGRMKERVCEHACATDLFMCMFSLCAWS